jgi:transposase
MMRESDRPATEIAREMGTRHNQLYKWAEQLDADGNQTFKSRGRPKREDQSALSKLKQENDRLREEVAILKKAADWAPPCFTRELK